MMGWSPPEAPRFEWALHHGQVALVRRDTFLGWFMCVMADVTGYQGRTPAPQLRGVSGRRNTWRTPGLGGLLPRRGHEETHRAEPVISRP